MRSALAALLLAAAVLAAWWWWPTAAPVPASHEPSAAGVANVDPVAASPPGASERADAAANVPRSDAPPIPENAARVEVRVVDGATNLPVAGADVWWKDASCDERFEALPEGRRNPEWWDEDVVMRTCGFHTRADERGVARVHAVESGTSVIARTEGRWGTVDVVPDDAARVVELSVAPDLEVTVRVVDGAGQPVPEVPVALDRWSGNQTDAAGLAVFTHLQDIVDKDESGAWIARDEGVRVAIPGLQHVRATFPLLSPPKDPVTLVLPATGEVHVRVLHPGREVESLDAELWIAPAHEDDDVDLTWTRRADADGVVRFHCVALAPAFAVAAKAGDFAMERTITGPSSTGQVVHATFELPDDAIALTGRIVTGDGVPIASQTTSIHFRLPRSSGTHQLKTDERGRFLWHPFGGGAAEELDEFRVEWDRGPLDTVYGEVERRELRPGVNDLGDIRLVPLPLVVAGRFQFDRPAAHDHVVFQIESWPDGVASNDPAAWRAVSSLDEQQDADGRFVVRGTPPAGRLRIECGEYAKPVEFALGTQNLVIPFVRGHALVVRTRVPKTVPIHAGWFDVTLLRDADPAD